MRNLCNNADIAELLTREKGVLLFEGPEGVIVRQEDKGTVMTNIIEGAALCAALDQLAIPNFELLVVKSRDALAAVQKAYGFSQGNPCTQWVYTAKEPPAQMDCDIRPLSMEYAAVAGAQYHHNEEYITERIQAGRIWGLFEEGVLAGFVGTHTEGAMGILEVFPDFRRKGYGYALEARLIAWQLEQGWLPYGHVVDGNEASLALQKRLGLTCAELPVIWTWREL